MLPLNWGPQIQQNEFLGDRGQVVALSHQSLCEHGYYKATDQSSNQNSLSHREQCWLADYNVLELK